MKCHLMPALDLGLVFTASLGPRASTKDESHASLTESQKVSQLTVFLFVYFLAMLNTKKLPKTIKHFQLTLSD